MEQMKRKTKKGRAAFTLTEFLTVIAIITILASLSFVAVIRYQRQLRRLEMDQTAKEIFLSAQNHLTLEISNGTIPRLLNLDAQGQLSETEQTSKLGIQVNSTDSTVLTADGGDGADADIDTEADDLYAILYTPSDKKNSDGEADSGEDGTKTGGPSAYAAADLPAAGEESPEEPADGETVSGNQTEEIRERLLPFGSIDETVRADGSYLIFYAPEAGIVREVWYSDRYEFVRADIGSTALSEAAADAKKRERFTGENPEYQDKKLAIGHYASGTLENPDVGPVETFQAPTIKLINDDILYAEIQDPNQTEHSLRMFVKGETSGTLGYIEVNQDGTGHSARVAKTSGTGTSQAGTYQVILDDVSAPENAGTTAGGFKFSDFNLADQTDMTLQKDERGFASFIPGENIYVYAQVFNNQKLSSIETSGTQSGSSLFAAIGDNRSALIGSFRHLENLDERVSGWDPDKVYAQSSSEMDPDTVTAMQSRNLVWKSGADAADESGYCGHVAKLHEAFGTTQLNKDARTISIAYRKVDTSNPDQTNPTDQKLYTAAGSYLPLEPQYVMNYQGNTKRIDGLQVGKTAGNEIQAADGTGGLFGSISQNLTVQNLWLRQPVLHTQDSAGAIAGEIVPAASSTGRKSMASVQLTNIQVEYPQIRTEKESAAAGALIGSFDGQSLTLTKTLAENHFRTKLGSENQDRDDLATEEEAAYRICAAKGTAGGLIGSSRGELSLTDCASALYVEGKTAGGLVGTAEKQTAGTSGQTGASVQIERCYVGGHTAEGEFQISEKPGEAAGANDKFENQPGRYNIAAYIGGIAGGLAAKLPADSQVSYSYVTASVYTSVEDDGLTSSAFIASYEDGTAGKLPSETTGEENGALAYYPGSYTSSAVNETEVISYASTLSEEFAKEKAENPPKNAFPYDAKLKAAPNDPMPTVQISMEAEAESDPSKAEAAKKLPWFLKKHVGDWVKVEDKKDFTITNGNRLYVDYVPKWTIQKKQEQRPSATALKYTYIDFSVTGELSHETVYYRLRLDTYNLASSESPIVGYMYSNTFDELVQKKEWNMTSLKDKPLRFEITRLPSDRLDIRFYIDNLSFYRANYGALSWTGKLIPGEYIQIGIAEDAVKTTDFQMMGRVNSCFKDVYSNEDEVPGTYKAEIANSRHLQNLSFCKEMYHGLKISKAVQVDNILWQEDPAVSVDPEIGAEAYCKEISDAYGNTTIYLPNYAGTPSAGDRGFLPIENPDLREYDGNQKIISKLKINPIGRGTTDNSPRGSALFQQTDHLTIKDLYVKDPDINGTGQGVAAVLVAQAGGFPWGNNITKDAKLILNNIYVYGNEMKVSSSYISGGLVASALVSELDIKNVYFYGSDALVQGGNAGGLVGYAKTDTRMILKNSFFSGYVIAGLEYSGGLMGKVVNDNSAGPGNTEAEFKIESCYVAGRNQHQKEEAEEMPLANIKGTQRVGGLIGEGEGPLMIQKSFSVADVYSSGENKAVGGLIGAYNQSSGLTIGYCYTAGTYKGVGNDDYRGYLIGQLDGTGSWNTKTEPVNCTIKDSSYFRRKSQSEISSSKLIGAPETFSLPKVWLSNGLNGTSWMGADRYAYPECYPDETVPYADTLQGQSYPFKIWTSYQGKKMYIGDWVLDDVENDGK